MTTDALIARLSAEPPAPPFRPRRIALAVLATVAMVTGLFLAIVGARPDLAEALGQPVVLAKTLLPALTCALALRAALRLSRPGSRTGPALLWLALPLSLAALLWTWAFLILPPARRFAEVGAFSLSECIGLILLLSLMPTATLLALLRRGATTTARRSAALAGLAASSGAATGYSFFCVQDNPLFYVTWYGVAILTSALLAVLLGARLLRW